MKTHSFSCPDCHQLWLAWREFRASDTVPETSDALTDTRYLSTGSRCSSP
jgi:hypothetical protein